MKYLNSPAWRRVGVICSPGTLAGWKKGRIASCAALPRSLGLPDGLWRHRPAFGLQVAPRQAKGLEDGFLVAAAEAVCPRGTIFSGRDVE